jgi:hypothetical protein
MKAAGHSQDESSDSPPVLQRMAGSMGYERPRSRAVWRRWRWKMKHSRRQTRPTYGQRAARIVGRSWRQPARPSAYGRLHGVRTSSQSGGLAEVALEDEALSTPNTADLRPARCADRRTVVATARPSVSVWLAPWRTNVLAVGRFGGEQPRPSKAFDAKHGRPTAKGIGPWPKHKRHQR